MTDVAPPSTAVWYDLDVTTTAVLAILRLTEQDVDVERIQTLVPAAASRIDEYLDGTEPVDGPPPPAQVQDALNTLIVELYRRDPAIVVGVEPNLLDPVRGELLPRKRRWGVA